MEPVSSSGVTLSKKSWMVSAISSLVSDWLTRSGFDLPVCRLCSERSCRNFLRRESRILLFFRSSVGSTTHIRTTLFIFAFGILPIERLKSHCRSFEIIQCRQQVAAADAFNAVLTTALHEAADVAWEIHISERVFKDGSDVDGG